MIMSNCELNEIGGIFIPAVIENLSVRLMQSVETQHNFGLA